MLQALVSLFPLLEGFERDKNQRQYPRFQITGPPCHLHEILQRLFRALQAELGDACLTTLKLVQVLYYDGLGLAFFDAIIQSDENTLLVLKNTDNRIEFLLQSDKLILIATAKGIIVNFGGLFTTSAESTTEIRRLWALTNACISRQ